MTPSPAGMAAGTEARDAALDDDGMLTRFLDDALAEDYPAPAVGDGESSGHPSARALSIVVAAVIGILIIVAIYNARFAMAERLQTRDALIERILTVSLAIDEGQAAIDERGASVADLQASLLSSSSSDTSNDISRLAARAGTTELSGPGVVVTIDDAPDAEAGSLNRVLDRDLQDIVNALWRSGATGIAVNEQRLTNATAIRGAGEAILVNYRPLVRPYRVSAVGTSQAGSGDSGLDTLLDGLASDYGLVVDRTTGDVALPSGELRAPRFASTTLPQSAPGDGAATNAGAGGA